MSTPIRQTEIDQAIEYLKKGGLVAIPTETVYGLAADASNETAVRKIFQAKGRPADHPLIVHIADISTLSHWARDIPDYAFKLAERYWPGPMTLILKKQPHVLDSVTGGQDTVGIRIPNHPVAQQLLSALGGGLAAPSANRFGYISPTSAEHVRQDLGNKIDMILEGGTCEVGIESTIIDCSGDAPKILRPGMITEAMLNEIRLGTSLHWGDTTEKTPRVSGALDSHYAPRTLTRLLSAQEIDQYLESAPSKNVIVLSFQKVSKPHLPPSILMPKDPHAYAHCLYEQLHFADSLGCQEILIEQTPDSPEWLGILDRITKASCLKNE